MTEQDLDQKIRDLIFNAQKIAVVPSVADGSDSFSAAAGMYKMLVAKGKNVSLLYPGAVPAGMENISQDVKITTSLGNRSLVVSIDYSDTTASKVNYTTENDVLYFYLSPVDKDFDISKVKAEITGPDYDLYITVGVQNPEDTGSLKEQMQVEMTKTKVLNVDNNSLNTRFGTVYQVDASMSSLALMLMNKAPKWDLTLDNASVKALTAAFPQ